MSAAPRSVRVIHGAGEPLRRAGRVYWEPMLAGDLGPGFDVRAPRMPCPEDPHYAPWARRAARLLRTADAPIVVGHSFGASVLLKYLAQAARPSAPAGPRIAGLCLIATPYWGPEFPEFALPGDSAARLADAFPLFLYHSRDDDVVPFAHFERYARAFPHATARALDGRGHAFDRPSFPELVEDILGVASRRGA